MCDDWELTHFGLTGVDPKADYDGDGMTNLEEYLAGTNPLDAQSFFVITGHLLNPDLGMLVEWSGQPGVRYTVQRSRDLTAWTNLATEIVAQPGAAQARFIDSSAVGTGHYFYRVSAQR
jgi:hypothetical protein